MPSPARFGKDCELQPHRAVVEYVSADPGAPITVDRVRQGVAGDILSRTMMHAGIDVVREYYVNDLSGASVAMPAAESWKSLEGVGVAFDNVVFERALVGSGAVDTVVADLVSGGHAEVRDGATWLLSSRLGDSQDRVLKRSDGRPTYLAVDLAYHRDKFLRGFDTAIDLWDTQHEAYLARTWAALSALGFDPERLTILIVHPVRVLEAGMERRTGPGGAPWSIETLSDRISVASLRLRLALFPLGETAWLDLDSGPADPLVERIVRASELPIVSTESDPSLVLVRAQANRFGEAVRQTVENGAPNRIAEYCIDLASAMLSAGRATSAARSALRAAVRLLGLRGIPDA